MLFNKVHNNKITLTTSFFTFTSPLPIYGYHNSLSLCPITSCDTFSGYSKAHGKTLKSFLHTKLTMNALLAHCSSKRAIDITTHNLKCVSWFLCYLSTMQNCYISHSWLKEKLSLLHSRYATIAVIYSGVGLIAVSKNTMSAI